MSYQISDIQIFIATRNRADYLQESIESVLNQTAGVSEITVLDNESTDNTEEIVKKYADRGVKYIKTQGFLGNYKKSQELANKEYVMFFHDDDLLHPSYLEMVLDVLNKHKDVALVLTRYKEFQNKSKPSMSKEISKCYYLYKEQKDFAAMMFYREIIAFATAIYKTQHYKQISWDWDKYNKLCDWPFIVEFSKCGKCVLFDDENLFLIRRHDGQDTVLFLNTPSVEQIINWDKSFYDIFLNSNDKELISMYDFRATHFLKGKYETFLSQKDKEKYTFDDVIKIAQNMGINIELQSFSKEKILKYEIFIKKIKLKNIKNQIFINKFLYILELFIFIISNGNIFVYETPSGFSINVFGILKTKLKSLKKIKEELC